MKVTTRFAQYAKNLVNWCDLIDHQISVIWLFRIIKILSKCFFPVFFETFFQTKIHLDCILFFNVFVALFYNFPISDAKIAMEGLKVKGYKVDYANKRTADNASENSENGRGKRSEFRSRPNLTRDDVNGGTDFVEADSTGPDDNRYCFFLFVCLI